MNLTYLVMKKILLLISIISWSYNVNAQCDSNLPVSENFDSDNIGVCWQVNDNDGDSNNWFWKQYSAYYGGYKLISSNSFYTSTGALTPDNWIISHAINLTSFSSGQNITLSWKVRGELAGFSHEYYSVYAATNNQTSSFTSSSVKRSEYVDEVGGSGTFVTRTLDVSSLAGNMIYVAFRHHNSTNQYNINIDDVTVQSGTLGIEDFNKDNFSYFYSPNNETLTLKSSSKPISSVEIYNLLGQNVANRKSSNTTENINLSNLVDGVYIAQIEIDNTTKAIKFIKQ
jgi:hypothetical protein